MPQPGSTRSSQTLKSSRRVSVRATEADSPETEADKYPPRDRRPRRLKLPAVDPTQSLEDRLVQARNAAMEAFAQTGSWVVFYREMLGANGFCRQLFPSQQEQQYFEATEVHAELQEIVAVLRGQDPDKSVAAEPEKVITIRLPLSLHKSLSAEAKALNLSVNKLCISKLLQPIDSRFVPDQRGGIPGPKSR